MNKSSTNIHAHHRERLRHRFNTYGYVSFEAHNMLELILFYGIPYKDTNPIAHNLISRFGDIINVLKAPTDQLTEISGVGPHASEFLHCMDLACDVITAQCLQKKSQKTSYKNANELGKMLCEELGKRDELDLYAITLNNHFEIINFFIQNFSRKPKWWNTIS